MEAFYLEKDGRRAENKCLTLDGATYLFLEDGTKAKGIAEYKGEKYYFSSVTGAMQTGFITVDEITYYFDPDQNGAMAVNTKVKIGEILYTFDENGKLSAQTYVNEDPGEDNSRLGHEIAEYALQFVGYPYVNGGAEDPAKGVDCSGFIVYVMKHFGISVPRMASEQINGVKGYKQPMEVSMDELKPGDLVGCYAGISHIGIYIGDGKMVHASNSRPYPSGGIKISDIQYYSPQRFVRYWY